MEKLKQALGGKCARCGSTENLEFDHIDRTNKSFNIAKIAKRSWSFIEKELSKCELLCKECHKKKSGNELSEQYKIYGSKCAIKIDQVDPKTGAIVTTYSGMREAARCGFSLSCISACCTGKHKSHRGFLWRYHKD